jgi:CDP-6-deoxy-D-xylo-4-hexulose-3-dehydrase
MKPVFVDINLENLSMNEDQVMKSFSKKTKAIFLSHIQGFNGLSEKFLSFIKKKKIFLIEDVCESHGAKFNGKKLGTFGEISNFSFYYAHHISTIEGGMICTNNKKIYELARVLRSHGLSREIQDMREQKKIVNKYKDLSDQFIFLHSGYNMRNTEIGGLLGLSQLKKLDKNIIKRKKNFDLFLKKLDVNKFIKNFKIKGNSNYAFPVILKSSSIKKRNLFENILKSKKIEFRRGNAGGGNMLRQPFVKKIIKKFNKKKFKNVEKVHNFGYYIGNYPSLTKNRILLTCKILNSIDIRE